MVGQLFSNPRVMLLAAAVLGLLGMVPECLTRYFYFLPPLCSAWWLRGREEKAPEEPQPVKMPENNSVVEATGMTYSLRIHWEWKWVTA